MLSGDNGLLKKAGQARDDSVVGQEKEQVELAYISAAVKKLGDDVIESELQIELDSSVGNEKTDVSTNDDNTLNVYFTDTENNYNVDNGKVTKATNYPLATTLLKTNTEGNTGSEKSPYVNYTYTDDRENKTILCRVLYGSESEYGIQIISNDVVDSVILGGIVGNYVSENDDYNNAVAILNAKAGEYLNGSDISENARCVGSNPNSNQNSEGETTMFVADGYKGNGQYKEQDDEYLTDNNQISSLGLTTTSSYWLASRTYYLQGSYRLGVRISSNLNKGDELVRLYKTTSDENINYFGKSNGFRPIFYINTGVKVIDGEGTETSPYILGK